MGRWVFSIAALVCSRCKHYFADVSFRGDPIRESIVYVLLGRNQFLNLMHLILQNVKHCKNTGLLIKFVRRFPCMRDVNVMEYQGTDKSKFANEELRKLLEKNFLESLSRR